MQYLGGKSRIAKPIAETIRTHRGDRSIYVEPFLGAGSVALQVASEFDTAILADASEDLVLLWHAVQGGWTPPTELSEETYRALRHAEPSALRGFAGFPCSFGGKWFGGYARDPKGGRNFAASAARSLVRRGEVLRDSIIVHTDYRNIFSQRTDLSDFIIYADPPYNNTTAYGAVDAFDSAEFWNHAHSWCRAGAAVLVSEYNAPDDWEAVWSAEPTSTLRRNNIEPDGTARRAREHLFTIKP